MGLFKRTKQGDNWLAFALQRDGIVATSVSRAGARPVVELAVFFPGATGADELEKAGKELRAASSRCSNVLATGEYQLLTVDAPNVAAQEVKTAVRWRLKDILDFPVDEATIDVLDMPLDSAAAGRARTMFVVAARNSVIAGRQKLFGSAKVRLSVIDIPEMAQRNIASMLAPEGRGVAMLSLHEDGALLTVSYKGELYLSRRIEIALAQLMDEDFDRRNQGFDRITLELQRSLDNFERQFSFINVAKLVLGPSLVTGLDEYLSSNLYTPVESLDLGTLFDLQRVQQLAAKDMQQRFFLAIGAALRSEEKAL